MKIELRHQHYIPACFDLFSNRGTCHSACKCKAQILNAQLEYAGEGCRQEVTVCASVAMDFLLSAFEDVCASCSCE